jgi:hypothetical protein
MLNGIVYELGDPILSRKTVSTIFKHVDECLYQSLIRGEELKLMTGSAEWSVDEKLCTHFTSEESPECDIYHR